jgi:hypothetical protein
MLLYYLQLNPSVHGSKIFECINYIFNFYIIRKFWLVSLITNDLHLNYIYSQISILYYKIKTGFTLFM